MINQTNNTSSYLVTNTFRLGVRQKRIEANVSAAWLYGEQEQQLNNNDFNSALDFNVRSRLQYLYYWGLGNFEKSYSLQVNNRTQAGLGLAYNILDRLDSLSLNISDGILYEYSNLKLSDTSKDLYSTIRNSLRLRLRFRLKQYLTLEGSCFLQQSLLDKTDYIIRSNAGLSLKLRKWLALTTALTYNKVTRTRRENLLLTFGATLEGWF